MLYVHCDGGSHCGGRSLRFKVTEKYPVHGNGGFDFIVSDPSPNRLYVSHGTEVDVLDADSGKLVGKLEDLS